MFKAISGTHSRVARTIDIFLTQDLTTWCEERCIRSTWRAADSREKSRHGSDEVVDVGKASTMEESTSEKLVLRIPVQTYKQRKADLSDLQNTVKKNYKSS